MAFTDSLIELKCKNCGSQLSPEDISPQLAAARCGHCKALFIEQELERTLDIRDRRVVGEYGA